MKVIGIFLLSLVSFVASSQTIDKMNVKDVYLNPEPQNYRFVAIVVNPFTERFEISRIFAPSEIVPSPPELLNTELLAVKRDFSHAQPYFHERFSYGYNRKLEQIIDNESERQILRFDCPTFRERDLAYEPRHPCGSHLTKPVGTTKWPTIAGRVSGRRINDGTPGGTQYFAAEPNPKAMQRAIDETDVIEKLRAVGSDGWKKTEYPARSISNVFLELSPGNTGLLLSSAELYVNGIPLPERGKVFVQSTGNLWGRIRIPIEDIRRFAIERKGPNMCSQVSVLTRDTKQQSFALCNSSPIGAEIDGKFLDVTDVRARVSRVSDAKVVAKSEFLQSFFLGSEDARSISGFENLTRIDTQTRVSFGFLTDEELAAIKKP
jgi:hypothetical protein